MKDTTCGVFVTHEGLMLVGHITGATRGPGGWSIPKGLADEGESHRDAAVRETMEETSIRLHPDAVMGPIAEVKYKTKEKTLVAFEALITEPEMPDEIVCTSMFTDKKDGKEKPEIDEFAWVHPIDAAILLHETQAEAMSGTAWRDDFMHDRSGSLEIYDFDGTIMDTLDAESGPATYKKVTLSDWQYVGWWSKPESLDCRLPFRRLAAATSALAQSNGAVKIIVTNRIPALEPDVAGVLVQHDIDQWVDHIVCSAGKLSKPQRVERIALALGVTDITVWEDREDQVQEYIAHGKILGLPTRINVVKGDDLVGTIDL
jgi:8-oxo-dGTP pyrophosphatase MutT (NUDIX family)